jgi:hypothetical protein
MGAKISGNPRRLQTFAQGAQYGQNFTTPFFASPADIQLTSGIVIITFIKLFMDFWNCDNVYNITYELNKTL